MCVCVCVTVYCVSYSAFTCLLLIQINEQKSDYCMFLFKLISVFKITCLDCRNIVTLICSSLYLSPRLPGFGVLMFVFTCPHYETSCTLINPFTHSDGCCGLIIMTFVVISLCTLPVSGQQCKNTRVCSNFPRRVLRGPELCEQPVMQQSLALLLFLSRRLTFLRCAVTPASRSGHMCWPTLTEP